MFSTLFLLGFASAAILTPLVIALYRSQQWLDDPVHNTHAKVVHTTAVPRGGGIVILFSTLIVAAFGGFFIHPPLFAIFVGAIILGIIGFFDDLFDVNPYFRFVAGFMVALLVVVSGIGIEYVSNPFGTGVVMLDTWQFSTSILNVSLTFSLLADILAMIWIVWSMNVVNWSKGLDGQLPGVVSIAALCIGILSMRFLGDPQQLPVTQLAFTVSGVYAGFLLWNMYPQKIMPGYGGGSLGGYFLAVLSILSGAKLATAVLVLAIPTADALFTIARRVLRGKSPFWGDRGHLHHKLLDSLGWSKRQIALFYWATTAILGIVALQLKPEQKLFTMTAITCLVFGFLIWAKLFISSSKQPDRDNG